MELVFNHVTRMRRAPEICIAGLDAQTLTHVRPVSAGPATLTRALLRDEGGPIGMGALVDVGTVVPEPSPPEVEDRGFDAACLRHVADLDDDTFLQILDAVAQPDLLSAFGPDLQRVGRTYAIEPGCGSCSLAVLRAREQPALQVDGYGKLRFHLRDVEPHAALAVTDVRFVQKDHKTIRADIVEDVNVRLRSAVDAFLMLGLARAHQMPSDDRRRHWLQLNGLALVDRPVGDRP